MKVCLAIGGFDPSSGAGVTAGLAVMAAHGVFGTACVTALTVQSTMGVKAVHAVEAAVVKETLEYLAADLPPAGIKIGMLGDARCVAAVAAYVEGLHEVGRRPVIVLDPVIRSSTGRPLLDEAGLDLLAHRLMPLVDWVTPNVDELAALAGGDTAGRSGLLEAGRGLQALFPGLGVVVTGGHREPPDDLVLEANVRDGGEVWLGGERIVTNATHGTGCAFSSAMLSRLVLGDEPVGAARRAKEYVTEALRRAAPIGHGRGPMHLLWPLRG